MSNLLPVIAIVGRPNVGKSTLFNRLTQRRDALVADLPGVTRDRIYGEGRIGARPYLVVDTGGLGWVEDGIDELTVKQTEQAVQEANYILFLVDGRSGLLPDDQIIAKNLRATGKPFALVINKTEGFDSQIVKSDFYKLGISAMYAIASAHGQGVESLMEAVLKQLPEPEAPNETILNKDAIRIAIVGRPNVGKSTLINRLLGEERVVVYDQPGTTRDSVYIPFERHGKHYVLIDTAGVRKRGQIRETIEKFSVVKTLQAIESCNIVVLVINAREGVTEQDLHLLGFVLEAGKGLVLAINKWDGLTAEQRDNVRQTLDRRLVFVDFARLKFISALHGTGVGELYPYIEEAYTAANRSLQTAELTRILEKAIETHQPPLVRGRRIKLRYAHPGGHNPPVIVIHGKQTSSLPDSYKRYLASTYRKTLKLMGTPVRLEFRDSENPYVKDKV
jgi:GTP-binding protein